jgi:hypothetical protein
MVKIILVDDARRELACQRVREAPAGYVVRISEPAKSREQEDKYHALIRDIARQVPFMGEIVSEDDWKRLLVDMFAEVRRQMGKPLRYDGRVVPSLDGVRTVQLGIQTRRFSRAEASDFIEFLASFGSEYDVQWREAERPVA